MKKNKYRDPFEQVDSMGHGVPFARLSDKQALSPTYQHLSNGAKNVLAICKLCRQYHTGYDQNGNTRILKNNPLNFYFNRKIQQRYGLKNPNTTRQYLVELVKAGFLDVVENGSNTRTKNIYRFSFNYLYHDQTPPVQVELSEAAQTFIAGKPKQEKKKV